MVKALVRYHFMKQDRLSVDSDPIVSWMDTTQIKQDSRDPLLFRGRYGLTMTLSILHAHTES